MDTIPKSDPIQDEKISKNINTFWELHKSNILIMCIIIALISILIYFANKSASCEQKIIKKDENTSEDFLDGPIRSDQTSDFNLNSELKKFIKKQEEYVKKIILM